MKVIYLSKKRFRGLESLNLSQNIASTEGEIFAFNYNGEKILKKLNDYKGPIFANKLYTLELLDTYKEYLPDSFYVPDYLCSVNAQIRAFTVPKIDGVNLSVILDSQIDLKEKMGYLKQIGEILQQLQHIRDNTPLKDIYINDLHADNFLVDNNSKQVKVIDLDSCKIGNNSPFPARYLTSSSLMNVCSKYQISKDNSANGYVIADENSDLYCYCIMILTYIFNRKMSNIKIQEFYNCLNYLNFIGFDKNLIDIFSKIVIDVANENPVDYIETITEKQIDKARTFNL